MKVRLENSSGRTGRFWEICTNDKSYTVTYGTLNGAGQKREKKFDKAEDCEQAALNAIQEKKDDGYKEVSNDTTTTTAPDTTTTTTTATTPATTTTTSTISDDKTSSPPLKRRRTGKDTSKNTKVSSSEEEENTAMRKEGFKEILRERFNTEPKGTKSISSEFYGAPLDLMLQKILDGPQLFPEGISVTETNKPSALHLTKEKTFCLMSLSFFGFLPYNFPDLLMNSEYAQCMANYYVRMYKENEKENTWMQKPMQIERRYLSENVSWEKSTKTLKGLKIFDDKLGIEDCREACQINFADPYPGGTLPSSHGDIVQEEILFLIYPELFITCPLVPRIDARESIVVSGLTRTNKYKGYQWSFSFAGDYDIDSNDITVIHMDALPGGERDKHTLDRELHKSYLSFINLGGKPVATGHWGCGAFGGNRQRKAIIQLIAAAEAEVDLLYTTYGTKLSGFKSFYEEMVKNNVTVGQIYRALLNNLGWGRSAIFDDIMKEVLLNETD